MKIVATTPMASPYTLARYRRFAQLNPEHELILVEFGRISSEYAWAPTDVGGAFRRVVLSERPIESHNLFTRIKLIKEALEGLRPDVLVVCGYGVTGMGVALQWARSSENSVPIVMLSDSTAFDFKRKASKEFVKRRVISQCASALVAGSPHRAYMRDLGMPDERIFQGYDVVDNSFFERATRQIRLAKVAGGGKIELPNKFFLTSARFLPRKNLSNIIISYHKYVNCVPSEPFSLVILGDGYLRGKLQAQVARLELSKLVFFEGFKQYADLPRYYGLASAFILASFEETWGLVVNEAMASGLPVIVSERCGCAQDLVQNGVNGYTFDPYDVDSLLKLMCSVSSDDCDRHAMGCASQEIIKRFSPDIFATGLAKAIEVAASSQPSQGNFFDKLLLWGLVPR
jgi:glycosyltransferase involved in cell wall biosynthesis